MLGVGTIALYSPTALAQIVPDETLGAERSTINRGVTVRGRLGDRIDGGATRGVNLFHSFQEFNVNEGQRVYFSNPAGIENILGRVTGSDVSDIMGTLGVDGGANLFLLNPNGILFGPNARLDIGGSFVASTGDRFTFPDGSDFSATNPQAPPLLTMRVPIGLQYGTGNITNQGQLTTGQDLTLSGDRLNLQGQLQAGRHLTLQARDTVQIRDSVTTPFVAQAGGELLVQGDRTVDIFALNHPSSGFFSGSDMTLRSANPVGGDAHYWSGGDFRIQRLGGARGDLISPFDPIILATGDVVLGDVLNTASLHILAGGSVTLGNVEVTSVGDDANTINPRNPNPFLAALATNGIPTSVNGGEVDGANRFFVDIRAGVDWSQIPGFPGNTVIGAPVPPAAGATTADIRVNAINFTGSNLGGIVYLTNQYRPNALAAPGGIVIGAIDTGGADGGGSVTVDARSGIALNGLVITSAFNLGSSGNVNFRAVGDITFNPGSRIDSSSINSLSTVSPSTIRIESTNGSVLLNNAQITASNTGTEFAGDVFIDARNRIDIVNGSRVEAEGNFGRIFIGSSSDEVENDPTAPTTVVINNSNLQTTNQPITATTGSFNAGNISVRANGLISVANGSQIDAATLREGNAGNIVFNAGTGDVRFEGIGTPGAGQFQTAAFSTVESGAVGDAGTIGIVAGSLSLTNGAQLQTLIREGGQGDAGNIAAVLTGSFTMNNGQIFSQVRAGTGNSGDIAIQASSVDLRNDSLLQAANLSTGLAGDITIASQGRVSIINSTIEATSTNNLAQATSTDDFSEIRLTALEDSVFLSGATVTTTNNSTGTDTTTDADDGIAGDIFIDARDRIVIQNQSTVASRGRTGRVLIGSVLPSATVDILNNPEDTTDQFGVIADGFAGQVSITALDRLQVFNSRITSRSDNDAVTGDFGKIDLTALTGFVLLDGRTLLSSTNFGEGLAGDIRINARDAIVIQGRSEVLSQGQLGQILVGSDPSNGPLPQQILIRGNSLLSTDNGFINDSTERAGNIVVYGLDRVNIINSRITSRSRNETDNFSFIQVLSPRGSVFLNSAELSTTNANVGVAGDISISARNIVSLVNQSELTSEGNFGRILIGRAAEYTTLLPNRIRVSNTRLSTSNQIDDSSIAENNQVFGQAGTIFLSARRNIAIANPIPRPDIPPSRFSILSETVGDEPAGNIFLSVLNGSVDIEGGFISSRTGLGVSGDGGSITVFGRSLNMSGGAQLSTSTSGSGDAGSVLLNVRDTINLDDVAIFSSVEDGASGDGGVIFAGNLTFSNQGTVAAIEPARSFNAVNGAQLITSTNGSGDAGSVLISARDVTFSGTDADGLPSAVFSGVDVQGTGRGGDVFVLGSTTLDANENIRTFQAVDSLRIQDGALITVSSFGQGDIGGVATTSERLSSAGNVTIAARRLQLQNNGRIIARTGIGNGGNIRSVTPDSLLLMSGGSRISSTAGTSGQPGNGGNIIIRTGEGFAIAGALGNNDISSDAFFGAGGRVIVDAQGIIGFVNRSRADIERLLGADAFNEVDPTSRLQTNDITAISQSDAALDGIVDINATDFDTRTITNLPANLADATQLIARNCPSEGEQELGEFVVTGRGGLPANPNEILGSDDVLTDWVNPTGEAEDAADQSDPQSNLHTPIVEAQQWMMNSTGQVVLVATTPNQSPNLNPALCNARAANPRADAQAVSYGATPAPETNAREISVTQH
ncbi:filamentous hemagglutinin N-terminal domain-containing protein [Oscillatoria sp. FACHB-1407]|nr:filamentous hemagglutinin N-terminal domain-containing protein [Oscillatoria sp. FACHB-1407]